MADDVNVKLKATSPERAATTLGSYANAQAVTPVASTALEPPVGGETWLALNP